VGVLFLAKVRIECRSTHIDIVQQVARFDVMVDDRSREGEGATSTSGIVMVGNTLDKCVDLVDWVGIIVVPFAVADRSSCVRGQCFAVVVSMGCNQRHDLSEKLVLGEAHSFRFRLAFYLIQGLTFLIASGALGIVNLLACFNEIRIQLFHFSLQVSDSILFEIELVILEGEFSVLGGNCSILLRDGILLGLDLGS